MRACCSLDFILIGINKAFRLSKRTELALKLSFNFIALFSQRLAINPVWLHLAF